MSDGTHPSNFAGNKTEWAVYYTIRHLSSKIRQLPSTHSVVMVAHLLILIKNRNIPEMRLDEWQQTNREVLNKVLWVVLQRLTVKQYPGAKSGYYNVLCTDGNFRGCKPDLVEWCADCPEQSDLHHLERHVCYPCVCLKKIVEIMCLLTNNTPGGITTYIERSAMPTPRQPMPNSHCTICTEDSTYFNIFSGL